jgi:hypothetical protein
VFTGNLSVGRLTTRQPKSDSLLVTIDFGLTFPPISFSGTASIPFDSTTGKFESQSAPSKNTLNLTGSFAGTLHTEFGVSGGFQGVDSIEASVELSASITDVHAQYYPGLKTVTCEKISTAVYGTRVGG